MKRILTAFVLMLTFVVLCSAHATLWDRGGGLIYDDVLDITFLQDANLAVTETFGVSGIAPAGGGMNWYTANEWIAAMNASNYLGVNTWRLPDAHNQDGSGPDGGYNVTGSELGHMYYNNLGGVAGGPIPDPSFVDGEGNTVSFQNLMDDYTTRTEAPSAPNPDNVWTFDVNGGAQNYNSKYNPDNVWPVFDGDISRFRYGLEGREYFPGITIGITTFGARFGGQILNIDGESIGHFDTVLNHQGGPIEQCGATNTIVYFKLRMKFYDGRRIVLVMPYGDTATADWDWDDAACPYGGRNCDFYSVDNLVTCESDVNPEISLIAEVSNIPLTKRQFGSRGFDEITGGILYGWLIHTPPIFPAVIGTFIGN